MNNNISQILPGSGSSGCKACTPGAARRINIINAGSLDYAEALKFQRDMQELRRNGRIGDALILLEHPPVITLGVRGGSDNILASADFLRENNVSVYEVERGGDVTYHGPGQIVGYPVIDLNSYGRDIRRFVQNICMVFIRLLKNEFDIEAQFDEKKYTGVWVGRDKITAIGISVRKWITMHGFAFNVNTDLEHFKWIVPCGLQDKGITSLEKLTGCRQDMGRIFELTAGYFCSVFGADPFLAEMSDFQDYFRDESFPISMNHTPSQPDPPKK
ncbi:MAG: lipoyl(octanoyl) transferase LipB [Eubacteriales bacterium]|nr:lipoyl(octanoyl) transferase LipB [Eubacteriales bacterium]